MFEAAIFDWDGTLADTRRAIVLSFQRALKEINLEVPAASIERRIGIGASDTFREILAAANRKVDADVVKQLVARKSAVQIELAHEVALFEGATQLLAGLQGKVKLGLASMNSRPVVMHLLTLNNLTQYFAAVLTVEATSKSKPDPQIFQLTAQQLKVETWNCVVFEDSIFGVKAAKAAGMSCIAVTTGSYRAEELAVAHPDLVVGSLGDPKILRLVLGA